MIAPGDSFPDPDAAPRRFEYAHPRTLAGPALDEAFEEIEVTRPARDVTQFRHARESSYLQMVILGVSAFLFMLFGVSIMPLMRLTGWGNALWVLVGIGVLLAIGFGSQAMLRVTTIRLTPAGIEIEQGTITDIERISIAWPELKAVDLEPVDPKDGRKGMQLRLSVRQGEPIDILAGVGVGDLTTMRRRLPAEQAVRLGATPRA